jgi:hypothetical protein
VEVKSLSREAMEEQLDKELEDKMTELDKKKKREKKKERQRKAKLRQRVALGMEVPDDGGVMEQESDLFSGGAVIRKDAADLILDQAPDEVLESPVDSEDGTAGKWVFFLHFPDWTRGKDEENGFSFWNFLN